MFNSYFAYVYIILIFAGTSFLLELLAWRYLKRYWRHLAIVAVLSLAFSVVEAPALWLKAWQYNAAHVLNIRFLGAELETYLFALLTSLAVAAATLIMAGYQDEK